MINEEDGGTGSKINEINKVDLGVDEIDKSW